MCFQETKTDLDKIKGKALYSAVPGDYEQHWNCSIRRKGYSGVGLMTKIRPLSVVHGIGIEEHDQEGRVLTAEFK